MQLHCNYSSPTKVRPHPALAACLLGFLALAPATLRAGEKPYFVTYDHQMEEPGNLGISFSVLSAPLVLENST